MIIELTYEDPDTHSLLMYTQQQEVLQHMIQGLQTCNDTIAIFRHEYVFEEDARPFVVPHQYSDISQTMARALTMREDARRLYRQTFLRMENDHDMFGNEDAVQALLGELKQELTTMNNLLGLYPKRGTFM